MSRPVSLIAMRNEFVVAPLLEVCRVVKGGSLILFSFMALMLNSGCSFSERKQQAQLVLEAYYDAIESQSLDRALDLYSPDFLTKHPRQEWENVLININAKLGELRSWSVAGWRVTSGPSTYCTFTINVTYSKHQSTETFVLVANESGQFLIVDHKIESLGLLTG